MRACILCGGVIIFDVDDERTMNDILRCDRSSLERHMR